MADATRSFQCARRFGRPADTRAEGIPIAERRFEHVAEVGVVDDEIGNPGSNQAFDVPDDQRFSAYGEQRLGAMVGEWAHALAPACGKNHRFHRHVTCAASQKKMADSNIDMGKVSTQAMRMVRMVPLCTPLRLATIVPAMPEERTCVVETGRL